MKEYRQAANRNVIHKLESGEMVTEKEIPEVVPVYYEEIFRLPLMDPISFPDRKNVALCEKCKKKWEHVKRIPGWT